MIPIAWAFMLGSLFAVALTWAVPARWAQDGVALVSILFLALASPVSALWLLGVAVGTPLLMYVGDRFSKRGAMVLIGGVLLVAALAESRFINGPLWIGGAYFTLRALHVLIDWWLGRVDNPGIRRHLHYQLFLPMLVAGPINRIQLFERQLARRRWDPSAFFSGAERFLFGLFGVVVIGTWLLSVVRQMALPLLSAWPLFTRDWVLSSIDWVELYFTFAGLSAVALGLALMMGLRLEENFNRPWLSRDLVEFWTRWHMTLSNWARDYVFSPVTALSRQPVVGLIAAMLMIGLWHEFSFYRVLWGLWQVIGIVLTRLLYASGLLKFASRFPSGVGAIVGPVTVLAWLALAHPAIHTILGDLR